MKSKMRRIPARCYALGADIVAVTVLMIPMELISSQMTGVWTKAKGQRGDYTVIVWDAEYTLTPDVSKRNN